MTAAGQLAYELQQSTNGGAWTAIKLPKATATSVVRQLTPGTSTYGFRVRARDRAGNWSGWAQGESFTVSAYQETAPEIAYTGTWTTQAVSSAYGGAMKHASAAGSSATFTFTGRSVSWVGTKASNRGKVEVWLDGSLVATVDLYSARQRRPQGGLRCLVRVHGDHSNQARATSCSSRTFRVTLLPPVAGAHQQT